MTTDDRQATQRNVDKEVTWMERMATFMDLVIGSSSVFSLSRPRRLRRPPSTSLGPRLKECED